MQYNDFTIIIAERQAAGYPLSAVAEGIGRAAGIAPPLPSSARKLFARIAAMSPAAQDDKLLLTAGESLFHWLIAGSLISHLRIAWDRATQAGRGLRLRLSIDAPEIAALPWELLYDPERDHFFSTSTATPLGRYLDQTAYFGSLATLETTLPLAMLLITPHTPDLNLAHERKLIEESILPLGDAIKLHVLDGLVTETALSDILMARRFDIIHFSGHGGFKDGRGYLALNGAEGKLAWLDDRALSALLGNRPLPRLVVLNACSSGQADETRAFRGMAMQMVRRGIPAAVAMQYPLSDLSAITFGREFYRQLCVGDNSGQVDLATAHARNIMRVRHPDERNFAAPILFTHAADGVIFKLPETAAAGSTPAAEEDRQQRLSLLISSFKASLNFGEDWDLANLVQLAGWRQVLEQAQRSYLAQLSTGDPDRQRAARYGLRMVQTRLHALESAIARARIV